MRRAWLTEMPFFGRQSLVAKFLLMVARGIGGANVTLEETMMAKKKKAKKKKVSKTALLKDLKMLEKYFVDGHKMVLKPFKGASVPSNVKDFAARIFAQLKITRKMIKKVKSSN